MAGKVDAQKRSPVLLRWASLRKHMYSATFIFDKKQYDEEFYKLDAAIAAIAKDSAGYLGEEAWENPETGRISNVYLRYAGNNRRQRFVK